MGISAYPRTPRLVNRFSLGCDPEFTFSNKDRYIYAENLGLSTMTAFGCDMAGRQAEIRAYPSKFALEVVASVVDSLRWMAYAHETEVMPLKWVATAYNGRDGCGGHIHFGRRRPNRVKEVEVLDTATMTLLDLGVFDKTTFKARRKDKHNYGQYGDFRPQPHGFEYRTLPTSMANPWLSYFVMVMNKLLLYWGHPWRPSLVEAPKDVLAVLKHFQDIDDDAAIALRALCIHGLPKENAEDFKPHWGIPEFNPLSIKSTELCRNFFPSVIEPEDQTCMELFEYLTRGTPLPRRTPRPTWKPFRLSKEFHMIHVSKHTLGHLPDVGKDLISRKVPVTLMLGESFQINHSIPLPACQIREALMSRVADVKFYPDDNEGISISVPTAFNKSPEQCKLLHKVLGDTNLFPVCKAKDLDNVDWSKWDNNKPTIKPMLGKLVARVVGKPKEVSKLREEW